MANHRDFLKEVSNYLNKLSESEDISSVDHFPVEEQFVDDIASRFDLGDESEASLSVSLSFIRMMAILVKSKEE